MCSYNAINGIPNCMNRELLIELLRNEWGFNGYVVSDCGAIPQISSSHHATPNKIEANQQSIKNGCDWVGACGGPSSGLLEYLNSGLKNMTIKLLEY